MTPVLRAQLHDVARQQVVHQDDVGTDRERRGQLAEAGVEAQRQRREDDVVGVVPEVAADALGADEEVAVAEHHALRPARAAGGVEDRGHVEIDPEYRLQGLRRRPPARGRRAGRLDLAPSRSTGPSSTRTTCWRAGSAATSLSICCHRARLVTSTRTSQSDRTWTDLWSLEQRVHGDEDQPGRRRREDRLHRLESACRDRSPPGRHAVVRSPAVRARVHARRPSGSRSRA